MNLKMKLGVLCLLVCGSVACRNQAKQDTSEVLTERTADSQQPEPQPFIFSIELKDRTSVDIITGDGEFNYDVDWDNDGTYDEISVQGPVSHDYKEPGTYTIRIRGQFPHMLARKREESSNLCGMKVVQWGDIQWKSMNRMFAGCGEVGPIFPESQAPDLSHVTDMSEMFSGAEAFNQPLNSWNTQNVISMESMFANTKTFNQPLDAWDTSNVTKMSHMFYGAEAFNQPLNSWDVSNVTDMSYMFYGASMFNQPLNSWNTSNVTDRRGMFSGAESLPVKNNDSETQNQSISIKTKNSQEDTLSTKELTSEDKLKGLFGKDSKEFNSPFGPGGFDSKPNVAMSEDDQTMHKDDKNIYLDITTVSSKKQLKTQLEISFKDQTCSKDLIEKILKPQKNILHDCYTEAWDIDKSIRGQYVLVWEIDSQGDVSVIYQSPTPNDLESVQKCVYQSIQKINFETSALSKCTITTSIAHDFE